MVFHSDYYLVAINLPEEKGESNKLDAPKSFTLDSIVLGGRTYNNVLSIAMDLSPIYKFGKVYYPGIIGNPIFQKSRLHFNFTNSTLVIEEVQYLYNTLRLQPACVVSYDRVAFEGSEYDPGLRVTFDTNLKCRTHDLTLLSQGYAENRFFAPPHWCVMEVKVNSRVPYWMTGVLSRHHCTLRRISKYCTALERSNAILHSQRINY